MLGPPEVGSRLVVRAPITMVMTEQSALSAGVVSVRATLRRPGGAKVVRTIRVPIPAATPHGAREIYLRGTDPDATQGDSGGDSATIDLSSLFEPSSGDAPSGPGTIAGLARAISGLHRYDGVTARILPFGAPVPQNLPGGAERFAQRARRVLRDPALRVAGRARLPIVVR